MGRHTSSGFQARLLRPALAVGALLLAVLATFWFIGTTSDRHKEQTRSARANDLRALIALTKKERRLVSDNARRPSADGAAQIDSSSRGVMRLVGDVARLNPAAHDFSDLQLRYGGAIYSASTPSHSTKSLAALTAIQNEASAALGSDEAAALSGPTTTGALATVETGAAALAMMTGALLMLWVGLGRPTRRRDSGFEARVQQLAEQARTDSLTRLGNHRAFQDDLTAAIATRSTTGQPFTLMAIDIDGLKQINDTRGHPAGDAHIRRVAECLEAVVKDAGTVYRTGGDEFMVLLLGQRNWHGLTLAARIDQATRLATAGRAVSVGLTESVGMEGRHLLVHQADVALYEAKRTRMSAVAYYPGLGIAANKGSHEELSHDQRTLAAALARAVDAKDVGTRSHSETVAQLCVAIGQRLNFSPPELDRLRLAGLLHDVGKIGVADSILQKPEPLGPDEQSAMTEHVDIGHAILLAAELPTEAHWILHHHERYDGTGYPERLGGTAIPIQSRIISVADSFEAMTGTRPYRTGMPVERALEELQANAHSQFDPRCVDALVAVVRDKEPWQALLDAAAESAARDSTRTTSAVRPAPAAAS